MDEVVPPSVLEQDHFFYEFPLVWKMISDSVIHATGLVALCQNLIVHSDYSRPQTRIRLCFITPLSLTNISLRNGYLSLVNFFIQFV